MAQQELTAFADKSVGDLKKSSEDFEKQKAADAAKVAADEKQKVEAEAAKAAAEQKRVEDLKAAEEQKRIAFETKTKGAADELFKAMDGWGTDEKKVFATLQGKSPEEIQAIKAAYEARTHRSLDADLTSEMSGAELKEAKALLAQDPVQSKVAALQNAMEGWGTDEQKVKDTLASITDPELKKKVVAEYEKATGEKLSTRSPLEMYGERGRQRTTSKKDSQTNVDQEGRRAPRVQDVKLATQSDHGGDRSLGHAGAAISNALKGKSPAEVEAIKAAFKEHSGKDLDDVLEDELSGTELKEAKALMSGDPVQAAVAQLHNAADGWGHGQGQDPRRPQGHHGPGPAQAGDRGVREADRRQARHHARGGALGLRQGQGEGLPRREQGADRRGQRR
ncbi:MAG: hypothetical protein IPQ07_07090 [Myxococcales bacterium]|nr:hypothetical protein [Myxococcales bacterium]